eukprot:363211-Chlamydomonas_euryale.AAC.10
MLHLVVPWCTCAEPLHRANAAGGQRATICCTPRLTKQRRCVSWPPLVAALSHVYQAPHNASAHFLITNFQEPSAPHLQVAATDTPSKVVRNPTAVACPLRYPDQPCLQACPIPSIYPISDITALIYQCNICLLRTHTPLLGSWLLKRAREMMRATNRKADRGVGYRSEKAGSVWDGARVFRLPCLPLTPLVRKAHKTLLGSRQCRSRPPPVNATARQPVGARARRATK